MSLHQNVRHVLRTLYASVIKLSFVTCYRQPIFYGQKMYFLQRYFLGPRKIFVGNDYIFVVTIYNLTQLQGGNQKKKSHILKLPVHIHINKVHSFFFFSLKFEFKSHLQQATNTFTENKRLRFLPANSVTTTNTTTPIQRPTPFFNRTPMLHKCIK